MHFAAVAYRQEHPWGSEVLYICLSPCIIRQHNYPKYFCLLSVLVVRPGRQCVISIVISVLGNLLKFFRSWWVFTVHGLVLVLGWLNTFDQWTLFVKPFANCCQDPDSWFLLLSFKISWLNIYFSWLFKASNGVQSRSRSLSSSASPVIQSTHYLFPWNHLRLALLIRCPWLIVTHKSFCSSRWFEARKTC